VSTSRNSAISRVKIVASSFFVLLALIGYKFDTCPSIKLNKKAIKHQETTQQNQENNNSH